MDLFDSFVSRTKLAKKSPARVEVGKQKFIADRNESARLGAIERGVQISQTTPVNLAKPLQKENRGFQSVGETTPYGSVNSVEKPGIFQRVKAKLTRTSPTPILGNLRDKRNTLTDSSQTIGSTMMPVEHNTTLLPAQQARRNTPITSPETSPVTSPVTSTGGKTTPLGEGVKDTSGLMGDVKALWKKTPTLGKAGLIGAGGIAAIGIGKLMFGKDNN